MHRIPPSQKIRKKTEELLNQGLDGEGDVTSLIVRLGVERLVQDLLEQEVTDYLERDHYRRRRPEQAHRGYRNALTTPIRCTVMAYESCVPVSYQPPPLPVW